MTAGQAVEAVPLEARLARLIAARQPEARNIQVDKLKPLSGGNARRAWYFEARWNETGGPRAEKCVLLARVETGQVEGDLSAEFSTLEALAHTRLPVPRPLWLDISGAILGMAGFVTVWVSGRAGAADLLKADSAITRPLVLQLIRLAAQLHQIDASVLRAAAPAASDAADPTGQMLLKWHDQFLRHRLEPLPALASVFGWLGRNKPESGDHTIVHGDFRVGNFLHDGQHITLLLDWELSHIGDPLEDLAWMYRPLWSPEHFVPLAETLELYEREIGRPIDRRRLTWWRIFCEAKFAVISLTAARNYVDGRTENLRLASRASTVADSLRLALALIDEMEA